MLIKLLSLYPTGPIINQAAAKLLFRCLRVCVSLCVCVDSFQSIIGSLCSYQFTQAAAAVVAGQLKVDAENGERKMNENPL